VPNNGTAADPSLSHPFLDNTITSAGLWGIVIIPAALIHFGLFAYSGGKALHALHTAALCLAEALAMNALATSSIKVAAGRLRPSAYARIASGVPSSMRDAHLSWPSGHASDTFTSMVLLALQLAGWLGVYGARGGELWRLVACWPPVAVAIYVGVTRVTDYAHHPDDVLAGAVLGAGIALVAHHLNYHPLLSGDEGLAGRPRMRHDAPAARDSAPAVQLAAGLREESVSPYAPAQPAPPVGGGAAEGSGKGLRKSVVFLGPAAARKSGVMFEGAPPPATTEKFSA
jgi:diacylglycerol diphosphate phosphatase/phosphatidate phosphatase